MITVIFELVTKAAIRADTEPPPGAEVLAPTFRMKSLTLELAKGPSLDGRQYSIMRSLFVRYFYMNSIGTFNIFTLR